MASAQGIEKRVMSKVSWRLLPFLILVYFACYLDRVNVGFAALTMNKDLGFTATMYGWGAGIFFLAYFLFEVPSNVLLEKFGARRWIARIMVSWGIVSTCTFLIEGPMSFYLFRFLLGVAEAGFFPGMIFYFTYWFPASYRAKIVSRFMIATPFTSMIGAPLSSWILGLDGYLGIAGWKWLFILEGTPTIILGFITWFYLTDRPAQAKWLEPEEREWLDNTIALENAKVEKVRKFTLMDALTNPRVLILGFVYLTTQIPTYGFNMWIPQIVKNFGGFSNMQVGFISAVPFLFAGIGMVLWGNSSDRNNERRWHLVVAMSLAGIGLILSAYFPEQPFFAMLCLCFCAVGIWSLLGVFWTIPPMFLTGAAAAGGIALVNSIGNLGGFIGPFAMGWLRDATGNFSTGLVFLGSAILVGAVVAYLVTTKIQKEFLRDQALELKAQSENA